MKTKSIILLAISALIMLSFTVVSVSQPKKSEIRQSQASVTIDEPVGGFVAEDKR